MKKLFTIFFAASVMAAVCAQEPSKSETLETMRRVADWQLENARHARDSRDWTWAPFYDGLFALAQIESLASGESFKESKYAKTLLAFGEKNKWKLKNGSYHADAHAAGLMYCQMYQIFKEPKMLEDTRRVFDGILENPCKLPCLNIESGRSGKPMRYWWCDALFMAPPAWTALYEASGERKYLDFALQEWQATSEGLYDKDEGLFYRDKRFLKARGKNGKKVFWSRGNGWALGGLTYLLRALPPDRPERAFFEGQFRQMSEKLRALQQEDGLWRADLLDPASYPNKETSGSSFFVYAFAWGVNNGLLDKERFAPAAIRGWHGLLGCIDKNGKLGFVQGVGESPSAASSSDNNDYGAGAFLLAGSEICKLP